VISVLELSITVLELWVSVLELSITVLELSISNCHKLHTCHSVSMALCIRSRPKALVGKLTRDHGIWPCLGFNGFGDTCGWVHPARRVRARRMGVRTGGLSVCRLACGSRPDLLSPSASRLFRATRLSKLYTKACHK